MTLEERAKGVKCGSHQVLVTHPTKVGPDGEAVLIAIPMNQLNIYEKQGYTRFIPAPSEAKEPKEAKKVKQVE